MIACRLFIFLVPRPGFEPGTTVPKTVVISISLSGRLCIVRHETKNVSNINCFCVSFDNVLKGDNLGDTGDKGQGTFAGVREILNK